MTNHSFSEGHNSTIVSPPVNNGKRSSSLSSLSSSLKLASNAFEMGENLGESMASWGKYLKPLCKFRLYILGL